MALRFHRSLKLFPGVRPNFGKRGIPPNFRVDINVRGDDLRKDDLPKIESQFNRWIEGLEEAFEE